MKTARASLPSSFVVESRLTSITAGVMKDGIIYRNDRARASGTIGSY
jgi:hypothetical protein